MRLFWIINAVLFQLCWWSAALFTEYAVWIMSAILAIHLMLSPRKLDDLKLLPIALVGICCDQLLIAVDVIDVNQSFIPAWLVLLWVILAWSFNHSLAWLTLLKPWQISITGGILGSVSYLAAINLGAISTSLSLTNFIIIDAVLWSFLLPLFELIRRKFVLQKEDKYV